MTRLQRPATLYLLVFVGLLVGALTSPAEPFRFDANGYWNLAWVFSAPDGGFSLTNVADPYRGYLLPLIIRKFSQAADLLELSDSTTVKAMNAALFAAIATWLTPRFVRTVWPRADFGVLSRILLAVVLFAFWRGFLNVPLSDFFALAFALAAIVAVGVARLSPLHLAAAGLAAAAAVNVRPAYVLLLPVLLTIAVVRCVRERSDMGGGLLATASVVAFVAGAALVITPQVLTTERHFDQISLLPGAAADLQQLQLTASLSVQRYDTFGGEGHPPAVPYADPSTRKLLADLDDGTVNDYGEYLEVLAEHPTTVIAGFARRIVNGLDLRYPTPVIEEFSDSRPFRIASLTLLFLGLLRLVWPAARRSLGPTRWPYLLALVVTAAAAPASAVETRFLLPIFFLAYVLTLTPNWPSPLRAAHGRGWRQALTPALIVAGYVAFIGVIWLVTRETMTHIYEA